jgi:hypothetical protein
VLMTSPPVLKRFWSRADVSHSEPVLPPVTG